MDISCLILTCLLLIQMVLILTMLNPVYDVRKITHYINNVMKRHRRPYFVVIAFYFTTVIYLGMCIPLQNIHKLIFSAFLNDYDKLVLLNRVEKNYIIAGFSLFLVVVLYGIRALLSYTSSLAEISDNTSDSLVINTDSKSDKKILNLPENILPNLLRVKRSISYETILFTNELRDQLKIMIRSIDFPHNRCALSSILETSNLDANL